MASYEIGDIDSLIKATNYCSAVQLSRAQDLHRVAASACFWGRTGGSVGMPADPVMNQSRGRIVEDVVHRLPTISVSVPRPGPSEERAILFFMLLFCKFQPSATGPETIIYSTGSHASKRSIIHTCSSM